RKGKMKRPVSPRRQAEVSPASQGPVRRSFAMSICLGSASRGVLQKQRAETSLAKMLVGGQGIGQTGVLHDQKGNAIRQAPAFVGTTKVEVPTTLPKRRRQGEDVNVSTLTQVLNQGYGAGPPGRPRQGIGGFEQHRNGGGDPSSDARGPRLRP